jgi:V-type H+-transporting ATPase subunit A
VFWGLDKRLAQRKHFPSVNWSISYTKYMKQLSKFYEKNYPDFIDLRSTIREILQAEENLAEIVQLVGKDSLGETDKVVLDIAKFIKDDFLAQNGFSDWDKYCPFFKTVWMLRIFVFFYEEAIKAIKQSNGKLTWGKIKSKLDKQVYALTQLKFQLPKDGQEKIEKYYKNLKEEIGESFRNIYE